MTRRLAAFRIKTFEAAVTRSGGEGGGGGGNGGRGLIGRRVAGWG